MQGNDAVALVAERAGPVNRGPRPLRPRFRLQPQRPKVCAKDGVNTPLEEPSAWQPWPRNVTGTTSVCDTRVSVSTDRCPPP